MIDPLVSLAFALYSSPGVYALLLGSGISRTAGILTGWQLVQDLIGKLAVLQGQDPAPSPEAWYEQTYGESPSYSRLLDQLAPTPAERQQILRGYFEPNDEEREQGLKRPTNAHRAIAKLVERGIIRVVITTNFDRLLEQALDAVGIVPTVISTPDAINGAMPLQHLQCVIIKLHGDYIDTRLKNTPDELASYDPQLDRLLDRILDEYGLIVSGWSGEWDDALRNALTRCASHRFTTYWTSLGRVGDAAQQVIGLRRARLISIDGADAFFDTVSEQVDALATIDQRHPLALPVAVARLETYLVEDRHRIRLNNLVMDEVERVYQAMGSDRFPLQGAYPSGEDVRDRMRQYESLIATLQAMLIRGCYWGRPEHIDLWSRASVRIGNAPGAWSGLPIWGELQSYPALLLIYAAGIAALEGQHYDVLATLLTKAVVRDSTGTQQPLVLQIYPELVLESAMQAMYPQQRRPGSAMSQHLATALREPFRALLPDDREYNQAFDLFEYFLALIYADVAQRQGQLSVFAGPMGRFAYRARRQGAAYPYTTVLANIARDAEQLGSQWPPLQAGLFEGSVERFQTVRAGIAKQVSKLSPIG